MIITEAIEIFLQAKQADRVSPTTLVWYKKHLKRLEQFLGEMSIDSVRILDLRRFALALSAQAELYTNHPFHREYVGSLSLATQQGILRAVRHFFRWLIAEGCLEVDPTLRLKLPPFPKQPPKGITPDDLRALLCATEGDVTAHKRDRALLLFLADTGCRVAGACGLQRSNLDMDRGVALVTEKGNKSRYVLFSEPTALALHAWLDECPVHTDWVFPSLMTGVQLQTTSVNCLLTRLKHVACVTGRCNPHSFRHAFARQYIINGGDLATLSDLLGHADISVTKQFYARFDIDELRVKHHRFSPVISLGLNASSGH